MPEVLLDDFESGSLPAKFSGDTGRFNVQNSLVHAGSHSLVAPSGAFDPPTALIWSDGGPQQGDTFEAYVAFDGAYQYPELLFGGSPSNGEFFGYGITFTTEQLSINRFDGSSQTYLSVTYSPNPTINTYYRIEGEWLSDGTITARAYRGDGTLFDEVTATDTTYSGSYYGYRGYENGSLYYDNAKITAGPSTQTSSSQSAIPTTASLLGAGSSPSAAPGAATAAPLTASATTTAHGSSASVGAVSANVASSSGVLTPTTISAAPGGVAAAVDGGSVTAAPAGVSAMPGPVGATTALATASATGLGVSAVYTGPGAQAATVAGAAGLVASPAAVGAIPGGTAASVAPSSAESTAWSPSSVGGPVSATAAGATISSTGGSPFVTFGLVASLDSGTSVLSSPTVGAAPGGVAADATAAVLSIVGLESGTQSGSVSVDVSVGSLGMVPNPAVGILVDSYGRIVDLVGVRDGERDLVGSRSVDYYFVGTK